MADTSPPRSQPPPDELLERAAALWGILPEYEDVRGVRHRASRRTRIAILKALGVPADDSQALGKAIENRLLEQWQKLLPETLVVLEGSELFSLRVADHEREGKLRIVVRREDGWRQQREVALTDLPETARAEVAGRTFVELAAPLPPDLPLGYHELSVSVRAGRRRRAARARLMVCPQRVYEPARLDGGRRAAGLAISLYALRSARNWGCGDFTDLQALIDWLADETGVSFVGLNPMHAIANRQPYNTSPYLPSSVYYRNPLYLDVERLEDFQKSPRAQRWFRRPEVQREIHELRAAELVEYERVWALKLHALKRAFAWFLRSEWRRDSSSARQFRAWCQREGDLLERFAVYCALEEWIRTRHPGVWVWPDWPVQYRDPQSPAVREFRKKHWRSVLFHCWLQWQTDRQLAAAHEHALRRGLALGLYHDLALATDRCGADFWAYRSLFVSGCRVGAPPDDFSPNGQDWSFPPVDPDRLRRDGYRFFLEAIRKNCTHGGALRLDHVMRLFRLYWIPEGHTAVEGAYLRQPHEELLPILALESVRNRVVIIGEDLGTVSPEIRSELARWGLLGYRVPYFEKHPDGRFRRPDQYPEQSLVCSTTHDLPTLAGFWLCRDIEARRRAGLVDEETACRQLAERQADKQRLLELLHELGLLPAWFPRRAELAPEWGGELHNAMVGLVSISASRLMVLTMEDLFKETDQQNLPASTWQYPNWRRKARLALEELATAPFARDCTRMFREWLERAGRARRP
ncbi:MAG: 4-alpha-glucanotransferase [Bryobacterales bacterium]|nr:4-alpha-glucanotransferase [Bryobacteraceae bacterium]MDW8131749.1 4-alpha-glucanotransferase [Bryobacterales bacterium]